MLQEISRRSIIVNKYEEPSLSWHNSILTVRRNKALSLFEYACDFNSVEKNINCIEFLAECSNGNPVTSKFLQSYVREGVDNMTLIEMVTDPYLRPHNNILIKETASIVSNEWSPANLLMNHQRVLAILNNFGKVDFFVTKRCGWKKILNVSKSIKNYLDLPDMCLKPPNEFADVKEIVSKLVTTAICWAPNLNEDDSCYFITGQKSGVFLFCLVKFTEELQCQIIGSFQSSLVHVEVMTWVPISKTECLLLCANVLGQVVGYKINMTDGVIQLNGELSIWPHEDRMVAKHLHYTKLEDKFVIIYNKYRNVVVQMYDNNFKLLEQVIKPVNGYKIISITNSCNGFYLGTINTKIWKINLHIKNNNIEVSLDSLEIRDSFQTFEMYGIGISQNGALIAAALIDRKVLARKIQMKIEVVFLAFENSFENTINLLINDPTKKLNEMWDLIEICRCKIFKQKNIPDIDYNKLLLEANYDIYKLKLYYAFLKFYTNLKESKIVILSTAIPETSLDKIRDQIFCAHACKLLYTLYDKQQKEELNSFQIECYVGTLTYIEEYCKKYNKDIGELLSEDILNQNVPNLTYECQCCDVLLDRFSCQLGHINMFCSVTFTPIDSDYIICKCGLLARLELYEQKPSCVLCDSYFQLFDNINK